MSDKPLFFVSLDLETSGSDHDLHVPIQIGLSVGLYEGQTKDTIIGGWDWTRYEWDAEAEGIHGIAQAAVDSYPGAALVDGMMAMWLWDRLPTHARKSRQYVVPLGWNVAGFDMPFVRKHLPHLASMFSYRALDLNSVCFFLGGEDKWRQIKMKAKDGGIGIIRSIEGDVLSSDYYADCAHDAGFDARWAMAAHYWLRNEYVTPF